MRRKLLAISVMAAVLAVGGVVQAGPIYIATSGADFDTLLGGSATAIEAPLVTDFSGGDLSASVVSQAFTDGAGHYLYLYQVSNTGPQTLTLSAALPPIHFQGPTPGFRWAI